MTKKNPVCIVGAVRNALRCVPANVKRLGTVAAVALLAASCATGTRQAHPQAKAVTPAPGPEVTLHQAGAMPRHKLRLHPKPGDRQTVDMTFKIAMDMQVGDMPSQAIKMPLTKMTMDLTVKSVAPDGNITYEMAMTDVSVADDPNATPQVVEAIKSSLAGLKGLSGTGVITDRGVNQGIEMKVPADADPQLRQALEQAKDAISRITAPLPKEAVGPGARWEFKEPIKSQGMTMDQTETYELVSQDGQRVSTKSTILQSASNQKIQNPAMQGLELDLTRMAGHGNASLACDLRKILPLKAAGDIHSDLSMQMDLGGTPTKMDMKMDLNLRLDAR
jgi:hypothetical protein